jgi:hypothetical protein
VEVAREDEDRRDECRDEEGQGRGEGREYEHEKPDEGSNWEA